MLQHHLATHLDKDEDTHHSSNNRSDSTLTNANPTNIPPPPRHNSQSISPLNTLPNSPHNNSLSPGTSIPMESINTNTNNNNNIDPEEDGDSMIFERNVEDPYFLNNHQQGSRSNSNRTSRAPSIHRIPTSISIQSDISNASSTNSTMMFPPMERHHTLENYVPPILDEMGSLVTDDDTNLEDISMIYDSRRPSSTLGLDMALGRRTRSYSNIDPNTNSPQSPSVHNNNNNNNSNKLLRLYSYADILYNDNPRPNLKPHHFSYSGSSSPSIPSLQQQQQQQQYTPNHQNTFIQPGSPKNALQETNLKNPFMLRHSETSTSYPTSTTTNINNNNNINNPLLRKNSHPLSFKNTHSHSNPNRFHIESSEEGSTDDEDN